jgi:hypothetical protein
VNMAIARLSICQASVENNGSRGCGSGLWLQVPDATPEGVFGALLRVGFSSATELPRALEKFAHIQEWAWHVRY